MPDRNSSPTKYRHGYQGQFAEQNTKTGYNDFILRNYNSQTGRWFAPDPYKQHFSPYVGMGNNSINGVDPDGGFFNTDTYAGRMALRRAKWAIQNAMMSFSLSLLRPSPDNNWDRYAGIGPSNPSSLENLDIRLAIMGMPDTDMGRALVIGKIMNKISEAKKYGYDLTSDMVAAGREINLFFEVLKDKQAYEAARDAQFKIDQKRAEAKMTASRKAYHRPPPGQTGGGDPPKSTDEEWEIGYEKGWNDQYEFNYDRGVSDGLWNKKRNYPDSYSFPKGMRKAFWFLSSDIPELAGWNSGFTDGKYFGYIDGYNKGQEIREWYTRDKGLPLDNYSQPYNSPLMPEWYKYLGW